MAASDAHARQVSVNEPSEAHLFRDDWVEIAHYAHDHDAQFELGRELTLSQCRFPLLPVSRADGARSESVVTSRSFRSRPKPQSFVVASANAIRPTHVDAAASASS